MELHHLCQFVHHGKNWGHLKYYYMEQYLLLTNIKASQTLIKPLKIFKTFKIGEVRNFLTIDIHAFKNFCHNHC
jgi:hypothetical protein